MLYILNIYKSDNKRAKMANVYFKVLNKNTSRKYTESIMESLQRDLVASAKTLTEDVFDITRPMSTKRVGLDVDNLLKYYILNQMMKDLPKEKLAKKAEIRLVRTGNNNYRKDVTTNEYYKLSNENVWIPAKEISQVNEDGSYVIDEKRSNTAFLNRKTYDTFGELISIQVINRFGKVIFDKEQAVQMLGLRKEFVLKHKYSGFSGNSTDMVAAIMNQFSSPKQTGYYMDNYYNLYTWDERKKCFMKNKDNFNKSSLLIDYEFGQNGKVIRKEYTGVR